MKKALMLPGLLLLACGIAGIYGMLHNQISYSVGPGYFHEFKFDQFAIAPEWHNRFGAAIVGWRASWWMGVVIGVPIGIATLFVRGQAKSARVFAAASVLICAVTLGFGLVELWASYQVIDPENLPGWVAGHRVSDPVAFARAGAMHNASYLGAIIGMGAGLMYVAWQVWRSRGRGG